jgi:hypothetical protein
MKTLLTLLLLGASPALGADAPAADKTAPPAEIAPTLKAAEPLDYTTITHTLGIDSLRAGSHSETGTNDYTFHVTMYGLHNSAEERNLPFEQRKKIPVELGSFGDTTIDSLAIWRPDEKAKDYKELRIDGNTVRELAARTMSEFQVQESDVAIMVQIRMLVKKKKFFFFGDDQEIAKAEYYPIPPTKFDAPLRTNQVLTITDDKGTNVKIAVRYEKPATAAKK